MTSLFESTAGGSFPAHPIRTKILRVLCLPCSSGRWYWGAFAVQIKKQTVRFAQYGMVSITNACT